METLHRIHELLSDAGLLRHQRNYERATAKAEEALRISESSERKIEPKEAAEIHMELGNIYFCDHLYAEAEIQFQKAVSLIEQQFYPSHPNLIPILDHLVRLYISLERFEDAQQVCYRLLDIMKMALLGSDCWYIETVRMTAVVEMKLGNYKEAESLISKVLPIVDSSTIGPSEEFFWLLAKIKEATGEPEAREHYERAIKIFDSGRGIGNRRTRCMMDYANYLQSSGEDDRGYAIRTRALALQESQCSEDMVDDLPNSKDYQRVPYPTTILH
ncbi:MAG: tetratricopeptide repeat protein [Candidatus Obscuribacterales bacterium]|jgi:tetratricopeptide (TPR) repeat protein|nr:tetratricopeptide repeat protein [Candidatus Obscuribacterales bacterium]